MSPEQITAAIVILTLAAGFFIAGYFTGRENDRMNAWHREHQGRVAASRANRDRT